MIIYVTSLILIALIGVTFAAGSTHPNTSAALSSLSRITYPTVILAFIFIPKVVKKCVMRPELDQTTIIIIAIIMFI